MTQTIIDLLEQYAETEAQIDVLRLDRDVAVDEILIRTGVMIEIDDIQYRTELKVKQAHDILEALKTQIHALMLEHGETVQSQHKTAKWCKPRVSWNDDGLCGIAMFHPEILALRREGEPSVAIVQRKGS
jgi:hypothetical protein